MGSRSPAEAASARGLPPAVIERISRVCELLGLNFNQPVRCSLSFRGFIHRGGANPHGWGIARFEGRACQLFKEPIRAPASRLATFIRDYDSFTSNIFIGHVRFASRGSAALCNTHPFVRTFGGREVVLAHNGTLERVSPSAALKFHPVGETDSEYLLCALLTSLSTESISFADFSEIEAVLRGFNRFGAMNLLFSEGDHLYAYRDEHGYNGLCVTERVAPFERVSLRDEDWDVELTSEKLPQQKGFVIATRPLTDEDWSELVPGRLHVFKAGERVYGP